MLKIKELLNEIESCQRCPALKPWRKFPIDSHGEFKAKSIILSEAPGEDSIKNKKYWSGNAGNRIRKIFPDLEELFYLTDTVKCCPPDNRDSEKQEIANCKHFLIKEIELLKPSFIIIFGQTAFKTFFSLSEFSHRKPSSDKIVEIHNKQISFETFSVILLIHPSWANKWMKYMKRDYSSYQRDLNQLRNLIWQKV